ncbi:MAG: hypothetical protein HY892_21430 [Deltaproteobacteria bacterium]|nr:hypothetical protein [Deltaproteobacteria bacterium]
MNNLWVHSEPLTLDGKSILLALEPTALGEMIIPELKQAGMEIRLAASLEEAARQVTFSPPDFLILSEGFGTRQPHLNPLLTLLTKLPAAARRNLIVVWVSPTVKTRDYFTAYTLSVNLVLQPDYLPDLVRLLTETWQEVLDLFEGYVHLREQEQL